MPRLRAALYAPTYPVVPDHDLPDIAFEWPDAADPLLSTEQAHEVELAHDVCIIHRSQFFIRGLLPVRVIGYETPWTLGIWVQIAPRDCARYVLREDTAASGFGSCRFKGRIANEIAAFLDACNSEVEVCPAERGCLPMLWVSRMQVGRALCEAQILGLTYDEILQAIEVIRSISERPSTPNWLH